MKSNPKPLDIARKIFRYPHPGVRKGKVLFDDERECKDSGLPATIRIHPLANIDLTGNIRIGAWTYIMPGVEIVTHSHSLQGTDPIIQKPMADNTQYSNLWIGRDVWLHRCTVLPGCTFIHDGVIVAFGSIVTKPIKIPYSIWAGIPAKLVGFRDPRIKKKKTPKFKKKSKVLIRPEFRAGTIVTIDETTPGNFIYAILPHKFNPYDPLLWIPEDLIEPIDGFEIPPEVLKEWADLGPPPP